MPGSCLTSQQGSAVPRKARSGQMPPLRAGGLSLPCLLSCVGKERDQEFTR